MAPLVELMLRYELGDTDYLEHRSKQIGKEFADLHRSKSWRDSGARIDE